MMDCDTRRRAIPAAAPGLGRRDRVHHDSVRVDTATPDELWKVVDNKPVQRLWQVQSCEPGLLLRLRKRRMPGTTWLEMRVSSVSRAWKPLPQRAVFYPRGITGRIYWYRGLPLHRRWFSQTFREVFACAGTTYGSSGSVTVSPEVRPPE
jgi:Protein of unknown function (DUF2867)